MPKRSIEQLHPESFLFDKPQFSEDLQSVVPQPGFKIFAAYRRVWWFEARKVSAGRSVTDLPLRQCYYWGADPRFKPTDEKPDTNCSGVLMASYSDGGSVEFWAGLARHPEQYRPMASVCPPGVPILDPDPEVSASAVLVAELQDQLRELHGLNTLTDTTDASIVAPYAAYYRDWTAEPFGGGWHFWRIGTRARAVMDRMRQPAPPHPVYVCGEAWSRQQGWVEGALESADEVLEIVLRLPRPDWLP